MLISLAPLLLALPTPGDLLLEDTRLATLPEGVALEGEPITDPNGDPYQVVHRVVWSPDGRRVAYVGIKGEATHPVIGDEVLDDYHYISAPEFSADGEHVLFRVGNRKTKSRELWALLYDGEEVGGEDWIGEPRLSPDGLAIAYWIQPGARVTSSGPYNRGAQIFCLSERKGSKWKTSKSPKYDDASSLNRPVFSADGKVVATSCMDGSEWSILRFTRGKKKPKAEGQFFSPWVDLALSPDGKRWAATVHTFEDLMAGGNPRSPGGGANYRIQFDGKTVGRHYDAAGGPVFSPKGDKLAYKVKRGNRYGIGYDDRDDVEPSYDFVYRPVFEPKGKGIAYVAASGVSPEPYWSVTSMGEYNLKGGTRFVVRESLSRRKPAQGTEWLEIKDLVFSPDGEHLAYAARDAEGWQVVLDEVAGPRHDEVGAPRFSEDSATLVHGARDGAEIWWRVWAADSEPAPDSE